jgi:hypothetical protein
VAIALAVLCWIPLPAAAPLMPVADIKAGMVGIGRTVFEGTDLQEFKAHIIGVLHNVQGPHRDLILARLLGQSAVGDPNLAASPIQPTSIDRHLAEIREGADQYRRDQAGEVANVAEMLAYLRRVARK